MLQCSCWSPCVANTHGDRTADDASRNSEAKLPPNSSAIIPQTATCDLKVEGAPAPENLNELEKLRPREKLETHEDCGLKDVFVNNSRTSTYRQGRLSSNGDEPMSRISDACMPELLSTISSLRRRGVSMNTGMMRGMRSDAVLRRLGSLLQNAKGSEDTFKLSEQVDHVDVFISHTWSSSRYLKWLALCFHLNFLGAFAGGTLTAIVLACMTAQGVLPLPHNDFFDTHSEGLYCCVSAFVVFYTLLLHAADILPGRLMRYPHLFLDKTCIHQVDEELKKEGVEHLGGFLLYSWSLVVLHTPVYTKRLWTVYEMACFLFLHPEGNLVWLPVILPLTVLALSVCVWLTTIARWTASLALVRQEVEVADEILTSCTFPFCVLLAVMLRRAARDQVRVVEDLRHFSIRNASCTVEADRATVEGNVASLMKDFNQVPRHCTLVEALSAFDLVVQKTMARWIRKSTGRAGMRYEYAVTLASASLFESFDVVGAHIVLGHSFQHVFSVTVEWFTWGFVTIPLTCAVCMLLCRFRPDLVGWQEVAYTSLVAVATFIVGAALYAGFSFLRVMAIDDIMWLAGLCLASAGTSACTWYQYRRTHQHHRRRTGGEAETLEEVAKAFDIMKSHGVMRCVS